MSETAPDDSPGYLRALHMLARRPGHAITLEEHRALTANSPRALRLTHPAPPQRRRPHRHRSVLVNPTPVLRPIANSGLRRVDDMLSPEAKERLWADLAEIARCRREAIARAHECVIGGAA